MLVLPGVLLSTHSLVLPLVLSPFLFLQSNSLRCCDHHPCCISIEVHLWDFVLKFLFFFRKLFWMFWGPFPGELHRPQTTIEIGEMPRFFGLLIWRFPIKWATPSHHPNFHGISHDINHPFGGTIYGNLHLRYHVRRQGSASSNVIISAGFEPGKTDA